MFFNKHNALAVKNIHILKLQRLDPPFSSLSLSICRVGVLQLEGGGGGKGIEIITQGRLFFDEKIY